MVSKFVFSDWPPTLPDPQLDALTLSATTYALSHGLLYLPPTNHQPPAPSSAIHAPLSLFPSPFPRRLFELARRLQRTYNILYARIAMDEDFLDSTMGAVHGVGKVDDFVGQLWTGWKQLRDEGLAQVCDIYNLLRRVLPAKSHFCMRHQSHSIGSLPLLTYRATLSVLRTTISGPQCPQLVNNCINKNLPSPSN
jgi:hypothetical protein